MSAIRRSVGRRRKIKITAGEFEELEDFQDFNEGDFNRWMLNHVLAVNPAIRFLTAMLYKSKIKGLSKLYYPDSKLLSAIDFDKLAAAEPFIYHNAWNLTQQELVLFANRTDKSTDDHEYKQIDAASLCACSALPFVEQTVNIDGDIYCEGALIDTVNFDRLLEDNSDLEEIWVSRLLDAKQILPPRNLYDAEANLCELFGATVGEDDVELFKCRMKTEEFKASHKKIKLVEIPVATTIDFEWSHSNLERGIAEGMAEAQKAIKHYRAEMKKRPDQRQDPIITPKIDQQELLEKRRKRARERLTAAE
jgi:predicted acylesterase/phospholipase RssA